MRVLLHVVHLLQTSENCSSSPELGWKRLWVGYLREESYISSEWMNEWMNERMNEWIRIEPIKLGTAKYIPIVMSFIINEKVTAALFSQL